MENRKRIMKYLKSYHSLESKLSNDSIIGMPHDKWFGCFGVQSYINLNFLEKIEDKYGITKLLSAVHRTASISTAHCMPKMDQLF
jgi:hypothetical protein